MSTTGLGARTESNITFLSIAGGFIWDRKAGKDSEHYFEQEYERQDKTKGIRTGAAYNDLTGYVEKVEFRTHPEYGESINVSFDCGGTKYIVSISTNNRYSQDMMKALLLADLEKPLFMKPYDFVGQDKKRAQGISFRQDGEKLELKVENAPMESEEFFKSGDKKKIKRFFEDLNDWYVAEVSEVVIPKCKIRPTVAKEDVEEAPIPKTEKKVTAKKTEEVKEEKTESKAKVSPLQMKKALRAYISENYEGEELPALSPDELTRWYDLAMAEEELPFDEESEELAGEESEDDLDARLASLK